MSGQRSTWPHRLSPPHDHFLLQRPGAGLPGGASPSWPRSALRPGRIVRSWRFSFPMSPHPQRTELRVELPADEVAVLDGHCQATGLDRTAVVRRLLREWSETKLHEAIVICRVAGCNPLAPEHGRNGQQR